MLKLSETSQKLKASYHTTHVDSKSKCRFSLCMYDNNRSLRRIFHAPFQIVANSIGCISMCGVWCALCGLHALVFKHFFGIFFSLFSIFFHFTDRMKFRLIVFFSHSALFFTFISSNRQKCRQYHCLLHVVKVA